MHTNREAVNPVQPISCGVLDTSGCDSFWRRMIAKDKTVVCLSRCPEAYKYPGIHDTVISMCQELFNNSLDPDVCGKVTMIQAVTMPNTKAFADDYTKMQIHAAHTFLENL
jgi:hypothetical protein